MLQHYRFQKPDGTEVTVTIEDILNGGVPIDPESGDDLEYLGPVEPYVEDHDPRQHPGDFRVIFAIDIGHGDGVHTAKDAARQAYEYMIDPISCRPVLDVICPDGTIKTFDLEADEDFLE